MAYVLVWHGPIFVYTAGEGAGALRNPPWAPPRADSGRMDQPRNV